MEKQRSFSLIEVMVAITVIMVGLIGVLGLIIYNISISRASPEKVVAVNLAQEGIEIIRNMRDSNWLAGNSWDENIEGEAGGKDYILHVNEPDDLTQGWDINTVGAGNDWKTYVYYDTNDNFYGQSKWKENVDPQFPDNWQKTIFSRRITITKNPDGNACTEDIGVVCTVNWTDRTGSHSVSLEDRLYNWKE